MKKRLSSTILKFLLVVMPMHTFAQTNGMTRYLGNIMQFYGNGTWTSVDQVATGTACSVPGQFKYSGGAAQFCNGTEWRSLNSGVTVAGAGSAGATKYSNGRFMYHNGTNWVVGGESPIHRWKMDEAAGLTIADAAPNPINGTFNNAVAVTSDAAGVDGSSLVFDGVDDYINVPNTGNFMSTAPFTWSTWVKLDTYPSVGGSNFYILRGPVIASAPWELLVLYADSTSNKFSLNVNNSGNWAGLSSDTSFTTNTWYHLAVTIDSSFNINMYVNGVKQGDQGSLSSLLVTTGDMYFGAAAGSFPLDGRMDDVRFYNRVLSAREISALYWEGYQSPVRVVALTSGTSWVVPLDWDSNNNTIEVIGGGGGGSSGSSNVGATGGGRFGGGGGAYSKVANVSLTPGATVTVNVGSGGTAGNAGGDTYFCNSTSNCASIAGTAVVVGAKGGGGGGVTNTTGIGGASASGIGILRYSGGNGNGLDTSWGGGGGGGAAGPLGNGRDGGRNTQTTGCAGGGGGGANNGSAGANGASNGGNGGNGPSSYGGATGTAATAGPAGWAGGGGAGGATSPSNCTTGPTYAGGAGGNGLDFGSDGGAGGGGGGGSSADNNDGSAGGAGGNFGGGGGAGGSRFYSAGTPGVGGTGGGGLIVIKYNSASNGPNHYYKLDETSGTAISDSGSDSAINGTFSGAAAVTSEPNTPVTTGVNFDGVDDYVTVANTGSDFSTVPFTWTAWVKADQLPSAAAQNKNIVIMGHSSAPWTAYEIWADDAGNVFKWTVRDSGGTARTVVADSALVANRWYHIAAILDSNYKSRLYIDGVLQSQTQSNASLFAPNSNLILGGNSSTNQGWDGPIDDIRFYKRALSPGEVKALYDSTKPIQFIQQTGLTANGETTPHSASFSTLPTAGNTIIVHFDAWDWGAYDIRDSMVTDNHGNTYYRACKRSQTIGTDFNFAGIWYAKNIKIGSPSTFTVTVAPTVSPEGLLRATEYSGLDPSSPLDVIATGGGTSTTHSSGTTATTSTSEQLLAASLSIFAGGVTSITTPGGWTDRGTSISGINPIGAFADRIVYSTGAYSASWTVNPSTSYIACIATFSKTPRDASCLGGFKSGGYCYYDGPTSTSCTNVCLSYGKRCNLAGTQAASASGTACQNIFLGLGRPPGTATGGTNTYGCAINQSSNAIAFHTTSTSVTCGSSNASMNRACACD